MGIYPSVQVVVRCGQTMHLRADHTLYLPQQKRLLAADVHLGKAETFQAHGLGVPSGSDAADLQRLSQAVADTGAQQLVFLGDLVHHHSGWTPRVRMQLAELLTALDIPVILIRGNHDSFVQAEDVDGDFSCVDERLVAGDFKFCHHPTRQAERFTIAGHIHPTWTLRHGGERLRLPCFDLGEWDLVLPAFSSFAGGMTLLPDLARQRFVIVEGHVVPI